MDRFIEEKCKYTTLVAVNKNDSLVFLRNASEVAKHRSAIVRLGYNDSTSDQKYYGKFANWKSGSFSEIVNFVKKSVDDELFASIITDGVQYVNAYIDNFNLWSNEVKIRYEYCIDAM